MKSNKCAVTTTRWLRVIQEEKEGRREMKSKKTQRLMFRNLFSIMILVRDLIEIKMGFKYKNVKAITSTCARKQTLELFAISCRNMKYLDRICMNMKSNMQY